MQRLLYLGKEYGRERLCRSSPCEYHGCQVSSQAFRKREPWLTEQHTAHSRINFWVGIPCAQRYSSACSKANNNDTGPLLSGLKRQVTFITSDGLHHTLEARDGQSLLDVAQANGISMEGACNGSCACSTCHTIVHSVEHYRKLEEPSEDENDMLDLAFGLTETSRLGCQVRMCREYDGVVVRLP